MGVTLTRTNLAELLPGTLDLLVLRTLVREANERLRHRGLGQIRAQGVAFTEGVKLARNATG
jgi:hypothetical protein